MKISRILKFIHQGSLRVHFSQYGEDVILHKLFGSKFSEGFYIDVGAHHPFRQSNTAYLWLMGWAGVNVDASKKAIEIFRRVRPNDVNVWSAVVDEETASRQKEITLYSNLELDLGATCDPSLAAQRKTTRSEVVPCMSLSEIINHYGERNGGSIDFLNIDIEGFDEKAVESLHFWKYLPRIICIEIYEKNIRRVLDTTACKTLESAGYMLIERVGLSAIFQRTGDTA
jgi:FkbM family methyltransferase